MTYVYLIYYFQMFFKVCVFLSKSLLFLTRTYIHFSITLFMGKLSTVGITPRAEETSALRVITLRVQETSTVRVRKRVILIVTPENLPEKIRLQSYESKR